MVSPSGLTQISECARTRTAATRAGIIAVLFLASAPATPAPHSTVQGGRQQMNPASRGFARTNMTEMFVVTMLLCATVIHVQRSPYTCPCTKTSRARTSLAIRQMTILAARAKVPV